MLRRACIVAAVTGAFCETLNQTTMNSPPEPGSPSPSTPSSGSPPPDEMEQIEATSRGPMSGGFMGKLTNSLSGGPSPMTTKRRLPAGSSFGAASNTRDAKTRRTQEGKDRDRRGGGGDGWGDGKTRKDKDELLDTNLVEQLRKDFGDPFLEDSIKNAA
ncbi:hypothetical protein HWV62_43814 [Athelia sp. TMB]|nr:hypothetical protein HWV62_43814 [Athelia sp. TMB]